MAYRWNKTKKKTVLRIRLGRDQGRSRCLVALSKRWKTGSDFGFSRTFDDPGPPTRARVLVFQGILGPFGRKGADIIKSAGEPDFAIGLISSPRWEQDTERKRRPSNDRIAGNKTEKKTVLSTPWEQ